MQGEPATELTTAEEFRARITVLEAALAAERARADALEVERDRLRAAHRQLQIDIELLRRRIFVAKAERVDTAQLELEFIEKKKELDELARRLGREAEVDGKTSAPVPPPPAAPQSRPKPKGRRDLKSAPMVEERHEILDPELEGKAERIGFEESFQIGWRKGGPVKIVIARAKYRATPAAEGSETKGADGVDAEPKASDAAQPEASDATQPKASAATESETPAATQPEGATIITAAMPKRAFRRCLAAPSLLAKIATDKFADGLPLFRQEERFEREGLSLDRGTMCRWLEDLGMTAGCVVLAMRNEAIQTAFCISTDATGIAVQPEPSLEKGRRACHRGHFFVMIADRDHVLFEYMPHETSKAVAAMLKGFSGYVQADAKSVYDILFRAARSDTEDDEQVPCTEVGCWCHARRRFYEAAIAKNKIAREALYRMHRIFELERAWSGLAPAQRKDARQRHAAREVDAFLDWAATEYERCKGERGLLRAAFGYVVRQRDALRRYLDDGRLRIDNNVSERELRQIAVGRKAWLFVGSDDHAQATANLFSLIASCRLHELDPERYLRDLIRVLPHWPTDRYLELAPKYWAATRARLDERELELPLGNLAVPPAPQQQPTSR